MSGRDFSTAASPLTMTPNTFKKTLGDSFKHRHPEINESDDKIVMIPLDDIIWYHRELVDGEPIFRDYDHERIMELADSLYTHGQMKAITVFPSKINLGKYEVLEGKQRTTAARENVKRYTDAPKTIRAEVLDYNKVSENNFQYGDLVYVNTNVYRRDELLPSEYAKAYEMQANAMKHQGANTGAKHMLDEISENAHTSVSYIRTVRRIIPKYCIQELIDLVDRKIISMSPTALYLTRLGEENTLENQRILYRFIFEYCQKDKEKTDLFFKQNIKTDVMIQIQKAVDAHEDKKLIDEDLQFLIKQQQQTKTQPVFKSPSAKALKSIIPAALWGDAAASTEYLRRAVEAYENLNAE